MSQFAFDFAHRTAFGRADFLVSPGNEAAVAWVERWPDWPGGALVLHGPPGCGKTHLARIWRERSGGMLYDGPAVGSALPLQGEEAGPALAVDGAESAPEEPLLHLYNSCRERGGSLLIVARAAPTAWPIALPDLASRLRAAITVRIEPPDDRLLGAVLVKLFADRQLRVAPPVIDYLVRRMERSFAAAAILAARLDKRAFAAGGAVTIPLARLVLAQIADQSSGSATDCGVA